MFKKMMKYTKAWEMFCEWIELKENCYWVDDFNFFAISDTMINNNFILPIMPFFFDKFNLHLKAEDRCSTLYSRNKETENKLPSVNYLSHCIGDNRKKTLIAACEKAFEILNNQLEK